MKPSTSQIRTYTIQQWLFEEAQGAFEIDLGESGIQHHYLRDLEPDPAFDLNYSQDRGNEELRARIGELYGAGPENIIITHGSQEALYLFYGCHVGPADHVLTFTPGWQQSWEVPVHLGAQVTKIALTQDSGYAIDWQAVSDNLRDNTRLLILCSPNNPLGTTLSESDWKQLEGLCAQRGIQALVDEEYRTDYGGSAFNRVSGYAVSSLSKIYGFPGLRIGWLVGDKEAVDRMVNLKRYTSVCNSSLCEQLALQVLGENRGHYLERFERLCHGGLTILREWVQAQPALSLIEPQGTPFAYLAYDGPGTSAEFCRRLLREQSVLLMPAEVFEDRQAVRLSFGREADVLRAGLDRIGSLLAATGAHPLGNSVRRAPYIEET